MAVPELLIFTCPKPMEGHVGDIQANAVRSWKRLAEDGDVRVLLVGDDPGVDRLAREIGVEHVPGVERNARGTPIVRSLFETAERHAAADRLCYVNADILLPPDFPDVLGAVFDREPQSVVVGRRVNLDVEGRLDLSPGWWPRVQERIRTRGETAPHDAIDYFAYPKGAFGEILPFAIGRFGWDNWLLYRARERGHSLVDVSDRMKVVHQNHDYEGEGTAQRAEEVRGNRELLTGDPDDPVRHARLYTLSDADLRMTASGRLVPNRSLYRTWRGLLEASERFGFLKPLVRLVKKARKLQRSLV